MSIDCIYEDEFLDLLDNFDDWKDKFYPVPATSRTLSNDVKRLKHCILKWSGVKKDVLKDYSLKYEDHFILSDDDFEEMVFATDTCALCVKYDKYNMNCTSIDRVPCPIIRATGSNCDSIYNISNNDPQSMIDLLEKTLEFVKHEGDCE